MKIVSKLNDDTGINLTIRGERNNDIEITLYPNEFIFISNENLTRQLIVLQRKEMISVENIEKPDNLNWYHIYKGEDEEVSAKLVINEEEMLSKYTVNEEEFFSEIEKTFEMYSAKEIETNNNEDTVYGIDAEVEPTKIINEELKNSVDNYEIKEEFVEVEPKKSGGRPKGSSNKPKKKKTTTTKKVKKK